LRRESSKFAARCTIKIADIRVSISVVLMRSRSNETIDAPRRAYLDTVKMDARLLLR